MHFQLSGTEGETGAITYFHSTHAFSHTFTFKAIISGQGSEIIQLQRLSEDSVKN